jgi:hypothetical protein
MAGINVPIGAATVEYGEGVDKVVFDITVGGIQLQVQTSVQDVTVDQFGDSPVKSILKGRKCDVTVPFALNDLKRLSVAMPNSTYTKSGTGEGEKIVVMAQAGTDLLAGAKKLVIKPTDPNATANDYVTIPLAAAIADPNYTYSATGERVCKITFTAYPDVVTGELYILGDETVA